MKRILMCLIPVFFSGLGFSQTDINLTYQSLLGGNGSDYESAINILPNGHYSIGAYTESSNLEIIGGFQTAYQGMGDGYIAIFNEEGQPVFTSYLGGSGLDAINDLTYDGSQIFLSGSTMSPDFPVTPGIGDAFAGESMGFITAFHPENGINWSFLLGGSSLDQIIGIALDSNENIYVTGITKSPGLGTTGTHQSELNSSDINTGFIAKYSNQGEKIWYTYFSGAGSVSLREILVSNEQVIVYGNTQGEINSASSSHQPDFAGGLFGDCVLASFDAASGTLNWFTYYGGSGMDTDGSLSIDEAGDIYISGNTDSAENISSTGSYQENLAGDLDLFVAKFSPNGIRLWGTYYGADDNERQAKLSQVDETGFILKGNTQSETGLALGNPILESVDLDPFPPFLISSFLARFDSNGNLQWSTYAPENYRCGAFGNVSTFENKIYIVGIFGNYPNLAECYGTTSNAYQSVYGGGDTDMGIFIYQDNTLSAYFPHAEPLKIYPNPTDDFVIIETPNLIWAGMELTVRDLSGRIVDKILRFQSGNAYNTNHLSNGVYILTGQVGKKIFREKVIVNR